KKRKLARSARKVFAAFWGLPVIGGPACRITWSGLRGLCIRLSAGALLSIFICVVAGDGLLYTLPNCLRSFLCFLCAGFNAFLNVLCSLLDNTARSLGDSR